MKSPATAATANVSNAHHTTVTTVRNTKNIADRILSTEPTMCFTAPLVRNVLVIQFRLDGLRMRGCRILPRALRVRELKVGHGN